MEREAEEKEEVERLENEIMTQLKMEMRKKKARLKLHHNLMPRRAAH